VSIRSSPRSTARKLAALTYRMVEIPRGPIRRPARAGPTMREALKSIELRATALARCFRSTRSMAKVCRAGASTAVTRPPRKAMRYTCHSWISPVPTSAPKTAARIMDRVWVTRTSR
jgi:hypothetical protein